MAEENELYPTTIWTEIEQLPQADEATMLRMLDRLLRAYCGPLEAHLKFRFRATEEQAKDWLQSFVWKKVLLQNLLANASKDKGRFRSFLVSTLDNFVRGELRKKQLPTEPLDEVPEAAASARPAGTDPFDLAWARTVLAQAVQGTQHHCDHWDRGRLIWEVFRLRLYEPMITGHEPIPYKELVTRLGFKDDAEAGNALITAKRIFQTQLRAIIREYVKEEAAIEAEIRELIGIFSGAG